MPKQAKIDVTFHLNFTPDKDGKETCEIKFKVPGAPPHFHLSNEIKRAATLHVVDLCHHLLNHPDGLLPPAPIPQS